MTTVLEALLGILPFEIYPSTARSKIPHTPTMRSTTTETTELGGQLDLTTVMLSFLGILMLSILVFLQQ